MTAHACVRAATLRPPAPPHLPPQGWGVFRPINATTATWNFKTVQADNGPAHYADALTIVQSSHVRA